MIQFRFDERSPQLHRGMIEVCHGRIFVKVRKLIQGEREGWPQHVHTNEVGHNFTDPVIEDIQGSLENDYVTHHREIQGETRRDRVL